MDSKDLWKTEFAREWTGVQKQACYDDLGDLITHQYKLISTNDWFCADTHLNNPEALYEDGYRRLYETFANNESLDSTIQNAIFANPLVQFIVLRAARRLLARCWYDNPSISDIYNDAFQIYCGIVHSFYSRYELSDAVVGNWLSYLQKALYPRLLDQYLTKVRGCKYDRKEKKYVSPRPVLDPDSINAKAEISNSLIVADIVHAVLDYVRQKNPRYAEALGLKLKGMLDQEIADKQGLTLNTVKSDIRRGRTVAKQWARRQAEIS
ncbi:hypothetical protein GE107_01595 [Cohnella sp. CFH 77786]|uniref:RNA polymerase sigma factor n=1 Tax=Cohnella sp. CFH 77786 TaxID=2662265 RepID=UPI001C60FDD9|nr:hypothetical protein [Cohnella sp. CFH 77786]MBW5444759.1 hypothetical protein [Cohnella sp. CFH 77786]